MRRPTVALIAGLLTYHGVRWRRTSPRPPVSASPWDPGSDPPAVSFLVAAWNAAEDIPAFVECYRGLSYPRRQLVLIAGGTDGSYGIANPYAAADVVVLEQLPGEGKQRSLRKGYPEATGEIIYLTDIDCRPDDGVVKNLIRCLAEKSSSAVTGSSRPLDEQMADGFVQTQYAVELMTTPRMTSPTTGLLGRNAAVTRGALEAAGAFEKEAPSGTDYTLAKELLRSGTSIMFIPGSPMPSRSPDTFSASVNRQARWVRNVFRLGRRYRAWPEVRQSFQALVLPVVVLVGVLLSLIRPSIGMVPALISVHAVLNRLWYQRQARLPLHPAAAVRHFIATQVASLRAGTDIVAGRSRW